MDRFFPTVCCCWPHGTGGTSCFGKSHRWKIVQYHFRRQKLDVDGRYTPLMCQEKLQEWLMSSWSFFLFRKFIHFTEPRRPLYWLKMNLFLILNTRLKAKWGQISALHPTTNHDHYKIWIICWGCWAGWEEEISILYFTNESKRWILELLRENSHRRLVFR